MDQRQRIPNSLLSSAHSSKARSYWLRRNNFWVLINIFSKVRADAIVVNSFDELEAKKDQIKGKIVIYNEPWTNYGEAVVYRATGADRAFKYGAVAALVRSVASKSIYSVHAGVQYSKAIPIAAITVEDAEMFARMQARGQKINLELNLENKQE